MKKKTKYFWILLLVGLITSSCSMDPVVADQAETKITNMADIRVMLDGAYNRMVNYRYWGRNMILVGEVRSDNMFSNAFSQRFPTWSQMLVPETDRWTDQLFNYAYATTATPNIILNTDLESIEGVQEDIDYMLGEAYAIRAMVHFDLLRSFGQAYIDGGNNLGVPYLKTFKEEGNDVPRNTVDENKADIYADIQQAIDRFTAGSSSTYNKKKTIFTLDAVYALQSRVGIYFKDYDYAYEGSSKIVDKYPVTPVSEVIEYWASAIPAPASIFELAQNEIDRQGSESISYIYRGPLYGDVEAFPNLITDVGFEAGDIRGSAAMIDYDSQNRLRNMGKYPAKDSDGHDNIKVFRIEEVVLNHAESLLMGNNHKNPALARDYLNEIPANRGAGLYTNSISIDDILSERRKELLFEGFRLHDLARYHRDVRAISPNTVNNHGLVKAGSYKFTLPIPRHELDANKNMEQNPLRDNN